MTCFYVHYSKIPGGFRVFFFRDPALLAYRSVLVRVEVWRDELPEAVVVAPVTAAAAVAAPVTAVAAPVTAVAAPVTAVAAPVTAVAAPVTAVAAPVTAVAAPVAAVAAPVAAEMLGLGRADADVRDQAADQHAGSDQHPHQVTFHGLLSSKCFTSGRHTELG